MTFRELMLEKFPSANINNMIVDCCPENFGCHTDGTEVVNKFGSCFMDCKVCWDSKVIDEKEYKEKLENESFTKEFLKGLNKSEFKIENGEVFFTL